MLDVLGQPPRHPWQRSVFGEPGDALFRTYSVRHPHFTRSKCKLASLTAEVAPVKSPKDHVATRGPGTPKVHHGTQNAVQVVVHLRNTQTSSRKELPAALRRRSGHESSADWLTATEQRDKNVAAACSCLFYLPSFCSISSAPSFSSILLSSLFCSIVLFLFYMVLFWPIVLLGSCSLAPTLLLLLFVLLFSSPLFSLLVFFETLLSSSSWIVLLAFFRSLLLVHEFSFVYRRVGGRRILQLGAAFQSSSLFGQPVVRGATFLHQHLSVRIILIESLVAAVILQVFQRPSRCASIGSLSLVAPTTILIKLFFLLPLSVCWVRVWVCGSLFSFSLCSLLLYRLNLRGTLGPYFLHKQTTSGKRLAHSNDNNTGEKLSGFRKLFSTVCQTVRRPDQTFG